jgi:hypothetical protein
MLSKFFKRKPFKGMPVAGIEAEGLAAMDNAWATLDVLGGHVDWSHGRPTIVAPGGGGYSPSRLWEATNDSSFSEELGVWLVDAMRIDPDGGLGAPGDTEKTVAPPYRQSFLRGAEALIPLYRGDRAIDVRMADGTIMLLKINEDMPMPFDAKVVVGTLYIYGLLDEPSTLPLVQVNQNAITANPPATVNARWSEFVLPETLPSTWYLNVKYESNEDYTNRANLFWEIDKSNAGAFISIPLFQVTANNEIIQHHRGQWDCWIVDADSKVLAVLGGTKAGNKGRSLERDDADGQLQLYKLHAPNESLLVENSDWHFVMRQRETSESGPIDVKYFNKADFITWAEKELNFSDTIDEIDPPDDYDRDGELEDADAWSKWWASHPHEILADIRDQTVGDDHRGGRSAASPITEGEGEDEVDGHPYIHANGDETRNAMTATAALGDADGKPSISPHSRRLYDVDEKTVVDYNTKELGTDLEAEIKEVSMYWADRHLIADDNESISLDWNAQGDNIPNLDPDTATAKDCAESINAILAVLRQYKIIVPPPEA